MALRWGLKLNPTGPIKSIDKWVENLTGGTLYLQPLGNSRNALYITRRLEAKLLKRHNYLHKK